MYGQVKPHMGDLNTNDMIIPCRCKFVIRWAIVVIQAIDDVTHAVNYKSR